MSPEGGFVAGAAGVTALAASPGFKADGVTVLNTGTGKPDGFIHRDQQALISTYLAESGNLIRSASRHAHAYRRLLRPGEWFRRGQGEKAYAKFQDGSVRFEPTASAPASASITAAQSGTTLTVSAVGSGALSVGDRVTQASGTLGLHHRPTDRHRGRYRHLYAECFANRFQRRRDGNQLH